MGVNLAATLPSLLAARKMTQERLAELTGIRRTDINALAKGRIDAGPKRLALIADALDVSVLDLGESEAGADARGVILLDRQAKLEAEVERLAKLVVRLGRRVTALEHRQPPESGRAGR